MIIYMFILGTLFGSFYLVVATRLLRGEDIVFKRSYCESCKSTLSWYNLIPVLSYFFQRGKCSKCHKKISIICPLIEIITGILFSYVFYVFGLSYEMFIGLIISSLLVIISITDFSEMIILDSPLVVSIILILVTMFIYKDLNFIVMHLLSGIVLFIFFYLIKIFGDHVFKKESMGGGDIKFSFIIGLVLGFYLSMIAVILSAFLALPASVACLYFTKNKEVAYGPFLVGALFLIFLNMDKIVILF